MLMISHSFCTELALMPGTCPHNKECYCICSP